MIRYYITGRHANGWPVDDLIDCIARNIGDGVDFIQIREKDLDTRALFRLTEAATARAAGTGTRIFVNDRADVAVAARAHGVHLRSNSVPPERLRAAFPNLAIAVSCHTIDDVRDAAAADLIVFGPVFGTPGKGDASGLNQLKNAVAAAHTVPVLALGGVNSENAQACLDTGAAGIAGIRLFQNPLP